MYLLIDQYSNRVTALKHFPEIDPEKFQKGELNHIVISLYSCTIKTPFIVEENGILRLDYRDFKLPVEGLYRYTRLALSNSENPLDDLRTIVEDFSHKRIREDQEE